MKKLILFILLMISISSAYTGYYELPGYYKNTDTTIYLDSISLGDSSTYLWTFVDRNRDLNIGICCWVKVSDSLLTNIVRFYSDSLHTFFNVYTKDFRVHVSSTLKNSLPIDLPKDTWVYLIVSYDSWLYGKLTVYWMKYWQEFYLVDDNQKIKIDTFPTIGHADHIIVLSKNKYDIDNNKSQTTIHDLLIAPHQFNDDYLIQDFMMHDPVNSCSPRITTIKTIQPNRTPYKVLLNGRDIKTSDIKHIIIKHY